jgi:tetratricopeptide (TPR) repeat protein
VALGNGNVPARVAIDRAGQILEDAKDDRSARATLLTTRATLFAIQRRFDEARHDLAAGRSIHAELGAMLDWAGTASNGGIVHLVAGSPETAQELVEGALDVLGEMGETGYTSTLQALRSEALYRQERYEESHEATVVSERTAAPDDIDSQTRWRSVRAKLLARQGKTSEAEKMIQESIRFVEGTDMVDLYADSLLDLAKVLDLSGRGNERASCLEEALRVYEARENLVGADRARGLLAEAQSP